MLDSVENDFWIVKPENYDRGTCEIETVTRGRDVPTLGYFVAIAEPLTARYIVELHNAAFLKSLQEA